MVDTINFDLTPDDLDQDFNLVPNDDDEEFEVEFGEVINIGGGTDDFNALNNRPSYAGQTMTGNTNIPKVPTKTSELTNDGADGTSTYVEAGDLAAVATSGSYNDLQNKPSIPAAQIQSDWTQADNSKVDYIKNKPTIPAAQVNSDWSAESGVAQIFNKPTIPAVVQITGTSTTDVMSQKAVTDIIGDVETALNAINNGTGA